MKKTLLILSLLASLVIKAQTGQLEPDMSKVSTDTVHATIVYLEKDRVMVDTMGIAIQKSAPMVFRIPGGSEVANTDKYKVISLHYFIYPYKKEIDASNIIFLKPKKN